MSRLLKILWASVGLLVVVEVMSAVYALIGLGLTPHRPLYAKAAPTLSEILDEGEKWGAWHLENRYALLWSKCYHARYMTNRYGMRDRERDLRSEKPRIALLGDSYAEGFGVEVEHRVSDIVERALGLEVLNFGSSGNLGILSYALMYEELVRHVDHDIVLILLSAVNDLLDHDPAFWADERGELPKRYRPYWRLRDGQLEIFYPVPPPGTRQILADTVGLRNPVTNFMKEWTWFGGVMRDLLFLWQSREVSARITRLGGSAGYADDSKDRLSIAKHILEDIVEKAGPDRRVMIVIHPSLEDIRYVRRGGKTLREKLEIRESDSVFVLDLAGEFAAREDASELFFSCDSHWSARGNEVVAAAIERELRRLGWVQRAR
jgi:hypothetical protein